MKPYAGKIDLTTNPNARINKVVADDFNDIATDIEILSQGVIKNKGYVFDGTDDYIEVANNDNLNFGLGNFSCALWFKTTATGVFQILVSTGERSNGFGFFAIALRNDTDFLDVTYQDYSSEHSYRYRVRGGTFAPNDGLWHSLVVLVDRTYDSGYPRIFIDGTEDAEGYKIMREDATLINVSNPYVKRFGANSPTLGSYFDGELKNIMFFNRLLSTDEINEIVVGKPLDYKYIGASQSNLIPSASSNFVTDGTAWWHTARGDLNWNSGTLDATLLSNVTNSITIVIQGGSILEVGKKYRVTFKAKSSNLNSSMRASFNGSSSGDINVTAITNPILGVEYQNYEFIGVASSTSAILSDTGVPKTSGVSEITFDDIVVTQIGCVANYNSDGAETNQWKDHSGNGNNGNVNGAKLITDWNKTESVEYLVSSNKTFTLPKDFIITNVMYENASGSTGDLKVGFGAGTNEIVNQTSIATGTVSSIPATVGKKTNANDTIYITTTQTMTVKVLMERV